MEQLYSQIAESIKVIFDLTSRIDERIKILTQQQMDSQNRIEKILDRQENFFSRLAVLENKNTADFQKELNETKDKVQKIELEIKSLDIKTGSHENKWKTTSDFAFKIIITIISVILAWRLSH